MTRITGFIMNVIGHFLQYVYSI